jgi:hypothetical protein
VNVPVYNSLNQQVALLCSARKMAAGDHQLPWPTRDSQGNLLPPNFYLFTIEALTADGRRVVYDPSDVTGGSKTTVDPIDYSREQNRVHFFVKEPAIVNIRVGMKDGGPLMNTLLDWLPLPAGRHAIAWNGYDHSGVVDLSRMQGIEIGGTAYSLPINAVIITGDSPQKRPQFLAQWRDVLPIRPQFQPVRKRTMYNHWQHERNQCYDPELHIHLPADLARTDEGLPVITGQTGIGIDVAEQDSRYLYDQRFEVVLYIDFLFLQEEEMGYLPYFWQFDPQGMSASVHYLTVMLRGYEGHFGTATQKIFIKPQ